MQTGKSKVMLAPYPRTRIRPGNVIIGIPKADTNTLSSKNNPVDHTIGIVQRVIDDKVYCVVPGTGGEEKFTIDISEAFLPILAIKQERKASDSSIQVSTLAASISPRQFKVALANVDKLVEWEMGEEGAVITKYGDQVSEDGAIPFNPEELQGMSSQELDESTISKKDAGFKKLFEETLGKKGKKYNKGVMAERARCVGLVELLREANQSNLGSDGPGALLAKSIDRLLLATLSQIDPEKFGKFDFDKQTKEMKEEFLGKVGEYELKELALEDVVGEPKSRDIILKMFKSLKQQ